MGGGGGGGVGGWLQSVNWPLDLTVGSSPEISVVVESWNHPTFVNISATAGLHACISTSSIARLHSTISS